MIGRPRCIDCRRPMRPSAVKASDAPGTVPNGGRGLCTTCTLRRQREGIDLPPPSTGRAGRPSVDQMLASITVPPSSPADRHAAALTVCDRARDAEEARQLLAMLGLEVSR